MPRVSGPRWLSALPHLGQNFGPDDRSLGVDSLTITYFSLHHKEIRGQVKPKDSTYGTADFLFLRGAITLSSGQKARCVPEEAERGDVVCSVLQEDRVLTLHAVQAGELRTIDHAGAATATHGTSESEPG